MSDSVETATKINDLEANKMETNGLTGKSSLDDCGEVAGKTIEAHFVTFLSPGTFLAEQTTKPIPSWDVNEAMSMARAIKERYNATPYGFRFTTRARGVEDLDSHETAKSPLYYLGGKVETLEQVKARATPKDRILISNMECNQWNKIITNDNSWSWSQPLSDDDVVLDWES